MRLTLTATYHTERQRDGVLAAYRGALGALPLPTHAAQGRTATQIGYTLVIPNVDCALRDLENYGVLSAFTPVAAAHECLSGCIDVATWDLAHDAPPAWPETF